MIFAISLAFYLLSCADIIDGHIHADPNEYGTYYWATRTYEAMIDYGESPRDARAILRAMVNVTRQERRKRR